jgi:hypothetical protein
MSSSRPLFYEKQKFSQWWLWLLLLALLLIPIYGIINQLILGDPVGSKPMSNLGMLFFSLFMFAFVYFFWYMTLITHIDKHKIIMQFIPFVKKEVAWHEVASATVVKYGFVGYGIRLGSKHGIVYNIRGNKGLAIVLNNGKKFLIGTQKDEELTAFLKTLNKVKTEH